jgi:branched-chain amino acid transport system ATP-binding protein
MEGGKVRLTGTAAEVRDHPEIASLYLGGATASTSSGRRTGTGPQAHI